MEWQPIETAPKDRVIDLHHEECGRMTDTWWDEDDKCWAVTGDTQGFTHWMDIPYPPKIIQKKN